MPPSASDYFQTKIIPVDGTVVRGPDVALNVDLKDLSFHYIDFYSADKTSHEGKGVLYPSSNMQGGEELTSLEPWKSYIEQADAIIYASKNPKVYYFTAKTEYQGQTTYVGEQITLNRPPQTQPEQTTDIKPEPAAQSVYTWYLYWKEDTSEWSWEVLNPEEEGNTKDKAISLTKRVAYNLLQLTDWVVTKSMEAQTSVPEDLKQLRTELRTSAQTRLDKIDTLTTDEAIFAYTRSEDYLTWPEVLNSKYVRQTYVQALYS